MVTTQAPPTTVTEGYSSGSGEAEDREGLIDDEDYFDDTHSNETSGSGSGDYNDDTSPSIAVGRALQRRDVREAQLNDKKNFQNKLQRILAEEEDNVRQEVGVVKPNPHDKSSVWSQPDDVFDSKKVISPLSPRQLLETDARDVFGSPVMYEYTDPVDVYNTVPKSK